MHRTYLFILLLFPVLKTFTGYSRQTEKRFNGDENHLRMCIRWSDSTEYQTPYYTDSDRTIYKYTRVGLSLGIYKEGFIYVATYKRRLNKLNPQRQLGRDY
ncbi:MAG: hypothetical protein AB8B56_08405 [Crocinitomicaceae bacterium]